MAFAALSNHSYRWAGLLVSLAGIAILAFLLLSEFKFVDEWEEKILIIDHYVIILGLVMLNFSQEKTEDERIMTIRFRVLRFSQVLIVGGIMGYAAMTIVESIPFSLYVVFYIIEASLIIYQVLFRQFLRRNPDWIFQERPKKKAISLVPILALVFLIVWLIYVIVEFRV